MKLKITAEVSDKTTYEQLFNLYDMLRKVKGLTNVKVMKVKEYD